MKKLPAALVLSLAAFGASAQPLNISFSNNLPVSRASQFPGCETSAHSYVFDVTMLGYNLSKSTCTAANLFPVAGYLTAGKAGTSRAVGATILMTAPAGVTFELVNFTVNDYGLNNTLYLDTTDSLGHTSTQTLNTVAGVHLYQFTGLTDLVSAQLRSANNRIDITAIQVVDSTP